MTLFEKIMAIYPEIPQKEFMNGSIMLKDDSDGNGAYIAKWEHPTLARPTQEQLDAAGEA